jgi:CheY-like chemotaxis protein
MGEDVLAKSRVLVRLIGDYLTIYMWNDDPSWGFVMEELFITLLKSAYDKTGWVGLFMTGGAFSLVMIAYHLGKASIQPILDKIFKKRNKTPPLSEHLIFKKYDFIRDTKLPQIKLKCPLRRKIFTRLISIRLQSHKKSATDFVNGGDYSGLTSEELKLVVREFVYGAKNTWMLAAHNANIPEIVLRKYSDRTADMKSIIHDAIDTICASTTIYPSNLHKLNGIFDLLMTLEEHLYVFLEQVLDTLNGELSKVEYEGFGCANCDDCTHKHKIIVEAPRQTEPMYMILYVEDDLNALAFLPKNLMANGLRVVVARSMSEARTMLCQRKFDAVILGDSIADGTPSDLIASLKIIRMPFIFATNSGLPPAEGYIAHNKFNNGKTMADSIRKQVEIEAYNIKKKIDEIPMVLFLCRDRLVGDVLQTNAIKHGLEVKSTTIAEEIISLTHELSNARRLLVVVDDTIHESALTRISEMTMSCGIPMTLYGISSANPKYGERIISRNHTVDEILNQMASIITGK